MLRQVTLRRGSPLDTGTMTTMFHFYNDSLGPGGNEGGKNPNGEDNEVLHSSSERFRMKLIRDFRLLENLTEMEAGLEAPKYHAQDIEDEKKRLKLLSDNPNALVKFHNVAPRVDNPKYKHLNEIQRKRLHKIKYRFGKLLSSSTRSHARSALYRHQITYFFS